MKLVNEITSIFFTKFFLILLLIMSNCLIEANQRITKGKIMRNRAIRSENKKGEATYRNSMGNKTFRYKMSSKAKITLLYKIKYLIVGFLKPIISNILNKVLDDKTIKGIIVPTINECFEDTYKHYESLVFQTQKKLNCDPETPYSIFSEQTKIDIQNICSKKRTIDQLDEEEFSTKNVIIGYVSNIFTDNSEFIRKYKIFKKDYEDSKNTIKEMTQYLLEELKWRHFEFINFPKKYDFITYAIEKMQNFFSKDICEIMEFCQDLTLWQRLKILANTAFFFVKCVPGSIFKSTAKNMIGNTLNEALIKFGIDNVITSLIAGLLPTNLLGIVFNIVVSGWSILSKMISLSWTYQPDKAVYDEKEKDLYMTIGSFLGIQFSKLIGIEPPQKIFSGSFDDILQDNYGNLIKNIFGRRKYRSLRKLRKYKK